MSVNWSANLFQEYAGGFLRQQTDDMKLAFEPIWPWPLIILACAGMLLVVAVGYPRRVRHLPPFWQRVLLGLRIALVLVLTFWLCRPLVVLESDDKSDAVLYVVTDASRSMETPDGIGGTTRRAQLLQLLEEASPMLKKLGETVEVRYRDLATTLTPFEEISPLAEGSMTAIGANFELLAQEANREKIAAILFWGDGKQAASGKNDVDPFQAAKLLARQHRPIYTVPFGTSEIASTTLDVSVSELDIARDVFIRNIVPIKVRFRALGGAGRETQVRVLVEQRSGVPNGTSGPMAAVPRDQDNITVKSIRIAEASEDVTIDLQFVPQDAGEIKVAVEVDPLPGEAQLSNNRVETIIRVRSGGIRVVYFDRIRNEQKWLRRINVSSRVQLDAKLIRTSDFAQPLAIDESWFQPGNYDAFIIGDVPAEWFGTERLQKIAARCDEGAGLMMIGGANNFGLGGYQRSPLARFFPIVMTDADQQLTDDIEMIPTNAALNNPILQIAAPDVNRRRWTELPPLRGANVFRLKEGTAAQVLAESKTRIPLLVGQSAGAARVLAFAGDTTWQWATHDEWGAEAHQRFWRQVIFWLTKMENDGETPLWINVEPRDLNPGRSVDLVFGLRDENGLPLANVDYKVNVKRPDGEAEPVTPRAVETRGEADYQNTMEPGDYWVNVAAEGGEGRGTMYASTRFLVNRRDPELDNPAADPALMRELAHVSGGDFLTPEEMLQRLQDWVKNGLPSLEMKRSERVNLWDNWFSLLLFVILLAAEWALRKNRGLV